MRRRMSCSRAQPTNQRPNRLTSVEFFSNRRRGLVLCLKKPIFLGVSVGVGVSAIVVVLFLVEWLRWVLLASSNQPSDPSVLPTVVEEANWASTSF